MLMIEFARRQRDLTQIDLASKTKIAPWFISMVENSRAEPNDDQKRRLARALGIPVAQLLEPAPELRSA